MGEPRFEQFKKFLTGSWRHDGHGCFIFDAENNPIAEVRGWGSLTGIGGHRLSEDNAVQVQKARGDLLASVTDLYAALEALMEQSQPFYANGRVDAGAWFAARAALAKARGEV